MKDFTDAGYAHPKRVCKDFKTKNPAEYHDLHIQSDTLLLADIFENFRSMCLKVYEFGPAKVSFSSWIGMASSFKKY